MEAKKISAVSTGENITAPNKVIYILARRKRPRKSRKHIIAVKSITIAAALVAIYGMLLMETHMVAGLIIFGICFPYLLMFSLANGGVLND